MSSTAFTFENVAKIIWGKDDHNYPTHAERFLADLMRLRAHGRKEPRAIDIELLLRAWEYESADWPPAQLARICKNIGNLSSQ